MANSSATGGPEPHDNDDESLRKRYRTIFISDLHLGTPGCQATALLDFLKAHPSDNLYLVGDIIDGWQLRRKWYWPQAHNDVVQKLLKRARMGLPYWSLSAFLKQKIKSALNYVTDFEVAVASEARRRGHQGVVCGHIHRAEMRDIEGVLYCNDGDWVESRTALVEHFDGTLELLHWAPAHETQGRGHVGNAVTA